MLPGVYEELSFSVRQAKTNILPWKAHILRSINQDSSRIDILTLLDESSVLVVQDWAMKYLPRKYRESQTDWFGKRGIPWHISVAFRKISNQFQMQTFAHIFQTCSQDSCAILGVMVDVIKQLKTIISGLKKVSFRQDNAGCYHCGTTIVCASTLGAELGSVPQGGKGACDRKAASIHDFHNGRPRVKPGSSGVQTRPERPASRRVASLVVYNTSTATSTENGDYIGQFTRFKCDSSYGKRYSQRFSTWTKT